MRQERHLFLQKAEGSELEFKQNETAAIETNNVETSIPSIVTLVTFAVFPFLLSPFR